MDGHPFIRSQYDRRICELCRRGPGDPIHLYSLPGVDPSAAEHAHKIVQADELSERLRRPLADISGKSGEMEREAPLFFGSGANPGIE